VSTKTKKEKPVTCLPKHLQTNLQLEHNSFNSPLS
jgi:hypothetical protein